MSRGRFVVFEGGEGSGKSTQAELLAERRPGALVTRQPGATSIGRVLRQLLLDSEPGAVCERAEALLMAADRAQHVAEVIAPALELGSDVICDRYTGSSLAYQGGGRGLGVEAVLALSEFAVDGINPDVVLLLDVPVEVGLGRLSAAPDRLESAGVEFHERVRSTFKFLANADPQRWVVIDATLPLDAVTKQVWDVVERRFGW